MLKEHKPAYFHFYPNDFSSDEMVETMTPEEVGGYILLLCKAWKANPPCSLPNDDTTLARLSRLGEEGWGRSKNRILSAFKLGKDGRLYQKRLLHEHTKLLNYYGKCRTAGEKGNKVRWSNKMRSPPDRHPIAKRSRKDRISESESESESKSKSNTESNTKKTTVADKSAISMVIPKDQNKPPIEAELKDLKALTPLQKVVTAWKELEGVALDDKAWDRLNWGRCSRTGNELLMAMNGDYRAVIDCMESVRKELIEKGLSYTIETVKKWAYKWMEKNGKLANSRE